jgi:hypothetical protein
MTTAGEKPTQRRAANEKRRNMHTDLGRRQPMRTLRRRGAKNKKRPDTSLGKNNNQKEAHYAMQPMRHSLILTRERTTANEKPTTPCSQ